MSKSKNADRIPPSGAFVMRFPSSISSYDIGPGRRVRRDGVAMWPERARSMSASEIEAEVDAALNRPPAPTAAAPKKPDAQLTSSYRAGSPVRQNIRSALFV